MVVYVPNPRDPLRLAGCKCPACGYELKGVSAPVCPECGEAFSIDEVRNVRTAGDFAPGFMGALICTAAAIAFFIGSFIFFSTANGGLMGCFMLGIGVVTIVIPLAWEMLN